MKRLLIICFFTAVLFGNNILYAQTTTLDSLISRAIEVSPKLAMYKAKRSVVENKIPQVSNLPDPMLTLGVVNMPVNSFSFTQEPMTGKMISLSQAFPFPGKLSAAENVSSKDVNITDEEIQDEVNNIKKNVADTYYELTFTRKAISLTNESKKLLKNISKVVATKYSVSEASQQNLVKVELEITRMNDKLEELKSKETSLLSTINGYLVREPQTPVGTPELKSADSLNLSIAKLDSAAVSNRPLLRGIKLSEDKAMLMERLADYEFYPNFNITLQYSAREQIAKTNTDLTDFFSAMVGISIPINYGGKKTAKVEEAKSMQGLYSEQYNATMQSLNIAFGNSLAKLKEIKEREKLIVEGMQPQASQSLIQVEN
jgi:outer membrane protein TolC